MRAASDHTRGVLARIAIMIAAYLVYTLAIALLDVRAPVVRAHGAALVDDPGSDAARARYLAGRRVWLDHGCQTCHSILGLGGHMGPDLTSAWRPGYEPYLEVTIRGGRGAMPGFALTDGELGALLAYLDLVGTQGSYPPRSIDSPVFGGRP